MGITVLLCGGATAGHIEPALNVAHELTQHKAHCEFVGTTRGLDQQLIEKAGFKLHLITPVPLPRVLTFQVLLFPLRLVQAIVQALRIARKLKPNAIVGFGSFVALPMYIASWLLRIPLVIHEANAKPGIANTVGARIAKRKFQTVDGAIAGGETVGTPLRLVYDSFDRVQLRHLGIGEFGLDTNRKTILIFGGSQGARHINDVVNSISSDIINSTTQILHVVGKANSDQISQLAHHHYVEYVTDMSLAYAVADLAICRSGALTVAEIAASNTPAIFVPFPIGNGEQEKNAQDRVRLGAALMLLDKDLDSDTLKMTIQRAMESLSEMQQLGQDHKPANATHTIARAILEVASV